MLTRSNALYKQVFPVGNSALSAVCKPRRSTVSVTARRNDRYCFLAPEESATQRLACLLARDLQAGDCYCLLGNVGAGKSVFSRAFIREAEQDVDLPVPSPTYLLQELYEEHAGPPIHHFDLYRLDASQNMERLNLAESFRTAVSLIEWADRLKTLPADRLDVCIDIADAHDKVCMPEVTDEQQDKTSQDQDAGEYVDNEWRRICLHPVGTLWSNRIQTLLDKVGGSQADTAGLKIMSKDGSLY